VVPLLSPENHLFVLARQGRRLTPLALALVLSVVFIVGGGLALAAPYVLLLWLVTGQPPVGQLSGPPLLTGALEASLLAASFLPIYVCLWLWLKFFEKRPFWTLGFEREGAARKLLMGFGLGLGMYAASLGLCAALGYVQIENGDPAQQGLAALGGVLVMGLGWAVQGPAEEVLCRGWLLQLGARYRPWVGVLVSSLVFTLLHALNPNLTGLALLNLFLFAVLAALYALLEGGLWGVAALHAAWNWAQGNVFGIAVSGALPAGGALLNLQTVGPDFITGGAFGSEGGLAVTAVQLIGIGVIIALARRPAPTSLVDHA
jgi:hypothetical protein